MKITILVILTLLLSQITYAQRIVPATAQQTRTVIRGGIIHMGNGQIVENGVIAFDKGKITYVGKLEGAPLANATIIEANGKEIYPGLIAPATNLGLNEIELVRSTNDFAEVGTYNPGTRSLTTYNTDSKIIPTVRSNGILIAQVAPQGGIISGASSIMQLDGWNWEDAQYFADDGIHLNWPSFFQFKFDDNGASEKINEDYEKQVQEIRSYFSQASGYSKQALHLERNINFEALTKVFQKKATLFIHADYIHEIVNAIEFAKELDVRMVIVGGRDSYLCTDLLKETNTAVILGNVHSLPSGDDVNFDIPYTTAAMLHQKGILYCLSIYGYWQQRNLPFIAGTTVANGISKEDALKS
ncbi:MAG: amidohydrolase, partial [Chitinophagales bacterium]|nr:amidohydrolase [Chitinophagales bacterium]